MTNYFVGIGFRRCGTSWINKILLEHPGIYKPKSGLHFFNENYHLGTDWYNSNFVQGMTNDKVFGEFSTTYSYPQYISFIAKRVKSYCPSAKIIFSFRNPVDRLISDIRRSQKRNELVGEVNNLNNFLESNFSFVERSLYYPTLKPFYDLFGEQAIHCISFEDIGAVPANVTSDLYKFLGVSDFQPPSSSTKLGSAYPVKSKRIERLLIKISTYNADLMTSAAVKTPKNNKISSIAIKTSNFLRKANIKHTDILANQQISKKILDLFKEDSFKLSQLVNKNFS